MSHNLPEGQAGGDHRQGLPEEREESAVAAPRQVGHAQEYKKRI